MAQLFLHNARVVLQHAVQPGSILTREGRIAKVFTGNQTPSGLGASESIDLNGAYLAPGFIDIHLHGSAGVDVQATDAEGLDKLSQFLLSEGVTGYFATLVPADEGDYQHALATIAFYAAQQEAKRGARILGIHFEGPFVNKSRCGALHREHFRTYDGEPRAIESFVAGQVSIPRLMTLAPEIDGGFELIRELTTRGVRVFIGHSQADPETLDRAAQAGARHITHFPNALEPLHHRKPGAVAWGLVRRDVTLDCIVDLHHVHPLMLKLIYQSKGADGIALISDAIKPAGLGDGEFSVWGDRIEVKSGRTTLAGRPGESTIAGSVITMRQAVKNTIDLGVPIHEAVRMATLTPSRVAGVESEYGSIVEGKRADLVSFDDDLAVRFVAVDGRPVLIQ
jgi:N-acetylglucosamine-6-phosphate deacetylase